MRVKLTQFTPFICSLSHLDNIHTSFRTIKKRQLLNPLDIVMEIQTKLCKYKSDSFQMELTPSSNP